MKSDIEIFYDNLAKRLLGDYLYGNRRIERQLQFFADVIHPQTKSILIIGCGTGEVTKYVARRLASNACILALDISEENIGIARTLFENARVTYKKRDVLSDSVEGEWELILLPDVYEHIPLNKRPEFHKRMSCWLGDMSRLALTLPSPYTQGAAKELQPVDEVVTLKDLERLADDVKGTVTYYKMISVWNANDYIHSVIERSAERYTTLTDAERLPVKGWTRDTLVDRMVNKANRLLRVDSIRRRWRTIRARRLLFSNKR